MLYFYIFYFSIYFYTSIFLCFSVKLYLCFVDDLDGDLLAGGDVFGELHLGEVALPDGLEQPIFSYVGLLSRSTPAHSRAWFALTNIRL